MSDKNVLIEMGFPQELVEKALKATNNSGLQPALDWIEKYQNGQIVESTEQGSSSANKDEHAEDSVVTDADAKSLKCDDCGKLLKSPEAAQLHAARTQHTNFSQSTEEIKPLTEEEKKQKLEELKQRLVEKKAQKAAEELAEQKEREKLRRISGKEIVEAKERQKEVEMKKAAEQKKREQREEREHRARVKAQIEADKLARAQKAQREKEGQSAVGVSPVSAPPAAASNQSEATVSSKDFTETRIQIRAQGKPPMTNNFKADDKFNALIEYLDKQGFSSGSYTLQTTFPRKTFNETDYSKTFKDLNLVPSAALVLSMK